MKKKKKYGQHFLKNESTAIRIANLVDNYQMTPNVLEIGPGAGALTTHLVKKPINLKCVEIDEEAVNYLLQNKTLNPNQIIHNSFLDIDLEQIFDGDSFIVIGNFPYNISSQIVFKALEYASMIPVIIGMFQKEVANRIISTHGNKQYGIISVLAQRYYDCKKELNLAPGSFVPPPKVMSSVISLELHTEKFLDVDDSLLKRIVKQSFGQRRKKLRNTLKPFITAEMENDPIWQKRPEQLSVEEFIQLSSRLK